MRSDFVNSGIKYCFMLIIFHVILTYRCLFNLFTLKSDQYLFNNFRGKQQIFDPVVNEVIQVFFCRNVL